MRITLLSLALGLLAGLSPLRAEPSAAPAQTSVQAILLVASKQPGQTDPRLAPYEATLRRVLRFESFRFVGQDSGRIAVPGKTALSPGAGHRLDLETQASEGDRLRLRVGWHDGSRSLMTTGLVLRPSVPAVLGGPATKDGDGVYAVLLIAR